jgi:integrase
MATPCTLNGTPKKRMSRVGTEYWEQGYYDERGLRRSVSAPTKKEAVARANARTQQLSQAPASAQTFATFAEEFMTVSTTTGRLGAPPIRHDTAKTYRHYLKAHVCPVLGDIPVPKINKQDMLRLLDTLVSRLNRRASAQQAFGLTKTILRYAVEREIITTVPGDTLKVQTGRTDRELHLRQRIPSEEEMRLIERCAYACYTSPRPVIHRAYRRYYPLFLILRTLGLRISEALGLQWGDFDKDMTTVHVRRRVAVPSEGLEEEDRVDVPKSVHGVRRVPVHASVRDVLRMWQKESGGGAQDWIFVTRSGTPMNYSNVVTKFWLPLLKRAGVPHYGLHALRHYYASLLIHAGRYKELSTLMGHHSPAFTMQVYGHMIRDAGVRLAELGETASAGVIPK